MRRALALLVSGSCLALTWLWPLHASQGDAATRVRAELAAARMLPAALDRRVTPVIDAVWDRFDRQRAIDLVRLMTDRWRLPGNPGYDASIEAVRARLVARGFTDVGTRPTGPITRPSLWIEPASTPSQGWDHTVARLAIVRPGQPDERVLSKEKERVTLAINSFSTSAGGVVARIIDVGGGGAAADYAGRDVKGAIVLGTAGLSQLFTQAVVNRGALGIVSAQPPPAYLDPNPELFQWGNVPYNETAKGFGFKAHQKATEALKAAAAAGLTVKAEVVSSFANRPELTLAAEIPGAIVPAERIVIAAHVQEPNANDNASGVATNMELAGAIATGIAAGRIPTPGRTLTFLWVNEISGSRRWLAEHADQKAGVRYMFSMDMTGEDTARTGGTFLVERYPDPGAVWTRAWDPHTEWGAGQVRAESLTGDLINDLHLAVCDRVGGKVLAATGTAWDVRSNPYEGGSDHTQFQGAGIPSVLDWHFTDRFYHTNQDTADKTSPDEMRNVGTAVAATAWLMASATAADGDAVRNLVAKTGAARVAIEAREGASADNATIVAAWRKWYDEAVVSVDRLIVRPVPPVPAAPTPEERRQAVLALGRAEVWSPAIGTALGDPDPRVRAEAANAAAQSLAGPATPSADMVAEVATLVRAALVKETHDDAGAAMLDALGRIGATPELAATTAATLTVALSTPRVLGAALGLESLLRKQPRTVLDAGAVAAMRAAAISPAHDARVRRLLFLALTSGARIDVATASTGADDPDWQVRRLALLAMASPAIERTPRAPEAAAVVTRRLTDPAFQVRLEAAKVAGRFGDCAGVFARTRDAVVAVVLQALDSLPASCGADAAVAPALQAMATDPSRRWQVTTRALAALARWSPARAAPLAAAPACVAHPVWQARAAVAAVAGRLALESTLVTLAADVEPNVRAAALDGLAAMNSPRLAALAVTNLKTTDFQLARTAALRLKGAPATREITAALLDSLAGLTALDADTSRDPRTAILERLGEQATTADVADLRAYLTDVDPEIARAAATLCARLAPAASCLAAPRSRVRPTLSAAERAALPTHATIEMRAGGRIELELFVEEAPATVARIARLARAGYYNGLTFHRWVPNFVIQGGSPAANEYAGDSKFMDDELGRIPHLRGHVGISTRGRHTGDAQIFIDLLDLPRLDHDYTVFARVVGGMDVADQVLEGDVIARVVVW